MRFDHSLSSRAVVAFMADNELQFIAIAVDIATCKSWGFSIRGKGIAVDGDCSNF